MSIRSTQISIVIAAAIALGTLLFGRASAVAAPAPPAAAGPANSYAKVNPGLIEDVPATPTVTAPGYNSDDVADIESGVVDKLWSQTDDYWHIGDYPRIVALDRTIVDIDPHFMEPYATGGWLIESMGDYKTAEAFYRLGVANNPNDSYMYYTLAAFYFNTLKDYQSAANVMTVGVTKRGNDVNDWRMYAHALEKSKHLDDAIAAWQTILKRFPGTEAAANNLARVENEKNLPATPGTTGELSL